jgi:hypothetical protein
MSNKIQIKRSIANSVVTGLSNGELAFTANGKILYIGDPNDGSSIRIGGEMVPGTLTANQALVANSTSAIDEIRVANLVPTKVYANGTHGSAGQVLLSGGGSANVYWGTGTTGSNTYVQFNDSGVANAVAGFTFDKNSNTLNVSNTINANGGFTISTYFTANSSNVVFTNGGISANAFFGNGAGVTSVNASAINGNTVTDIVTLAVSNSQSNNNTFSGNNIFNGTNTAFGSNVTFTGANVNIGGTNTIFSSNTTFNGTNTVFGSNVAFSAYIGSNIKPTVNNSYDLGTDGLRWGTVYANTVNAVSGNFGNVSITGDLTVSGNVTTIDVNSIVVGDPLIYLAANNDSSDTLDIGFVGQYFKSSEIRAAGLFRDHEDGVFKLFRDLSRATLPGDRLISNNNVDTTDGTYVIATLQAYLDSGALVSNNLAVTITANSSVNVNITANSLSLSTALSSTSGGTGHGSYTTGDILVANTGNALSVLTLSSTAGHVLQSNGSALIYDILDGGTF